MLNNEILDLIVKEHGFEEFRYFKDYDPVNYNKKISNQIYTFGFKAGDRVFLKELPRTLVDLETSLGPRRFKKKILLYDHYTPQSIDSVANSEITQQTNEEVDQIEPNTNGLVDNDNSVLEKLYDFLFKMSNNLNRTGGSVVRVVNKKPKIILSCQFCEQIISVGYKLTVSCLPSFMRTNLLKHNLLMKIPEILVMISKLINFFSECLIRFICSLILQIVLKI